MNEQRRYNKQRVKITASGNKEIGATLLSQVLSFLNKAPHLHADEWFALQGIIKQLERGNTNHPVKVLKAMERKFEKIQQNYNQEQR